MKRFTHIAFWVLLLLPTFLLAQSKECALSFTYEQIDTYHVQLHAISAPDSLEYVWETNLSGTYTGQDPIIEIPADSSDQVCLFVTNDTLDCEEFCDLVYTSFESYNADFSIEEGNPVIGWTFTSQSLGEEPINHQWRIDGLFAGNNEILEYNFTEFGTYNVCLIIETATGCIDTTCQTITVTDTINCEVEFNTSLNHQFAEFSATASGATPFTYNWTINDEPQGNESTLIFEFSESGTYSICVYLTASNGCETSYCEDITIGEILPYFSLSGQVYADNNPVNTEIHCYKDNQLIKSTTSTLGQFEFSKLFHGEYKLLAISPQTDYHDTWYGDKLSMENAWGIDLIGNTWDVDIHLQHTNSSITNNQQTFNIYPNPVDNLLTIQSDNTIQRISIINHSGRIVEIRDDNFNRIDMSNYASGIYVLEIQFQDKVIRKKVIKS